jgi:hypothetical protein
MKRAKKSGTAQAVGRSGRTGCSAFFRTKYRIVKDGYAGYEAQFKRWWSPVWMQCGFCNTSGTVEMARKICDLHTRGGVVEEYLPNPSFQGTPHETTKGN